jgi:1-acyl-sn-glycerol-3-phosphate acyltransferase
MPEQIRQPIKIRPNKLFWIIRSFIAIYIRIFCRLKCFGAENVPRQGCLIIASNHVAAADPFILGSAIPRELAFMAKKELFETFFVGWLIRRVNAFSVDRFGFDLETIKKSLAVLDKGMALMMFPEGTRSKDGQLGEGKIGIGLLARKAGAPIVPVYIANSTAAWFNFLKGKRFEAHFGKIIDSDWIKAQENSKAGYQAITDEVMKRIGELKA